LLAACPQSGSIRMRAPPTNHLGGSAEPASINEPVGSRNHLRWRFGGLLLVDYR